MPILAVLRKLLEKYKTVDTPKSALTQACNYALERWDGLCRYCEEGYYDIDKGGIRDVDNIVEGTTSSSAASGPSPSDARTGSSSTATNRHATQPYTSPS